MWTESARRSQAARDSVQGPRPGWPEFEPDDTNPDAELVGETGRPLVAIRPELELLTIASVFVSVVAVAATAATRPAPDGDAFASVAFPAAYVAVLNAWSLTGLRRRYLRSPRAWPEGARAAPAQVAAPRAKYAVVSAAAVLAVAIWLLVDPSDGGAWVASAIVVANAVGSALALVRVSIAERRLGASLYRPKPRSPWGDRTTTVGFAGPPQA